MPLSIKVQPGTESVGRKKAEALAEKTGKQVSLLQPFYKYSRSGSVRTVWTTYDTVYPIKRNPRGTGTGNGNMAKRRRRNPGTRIPGIAGWSTMAGGSSAAPGKRAYDFRTAKQTYTINPISSQYGRHQGYRLTVYPGNPAHGHQQIGGLHRSPAAAAKAARVWAQTNDVSVGNPRRRNAGDYTVKKSGDNYVILFRGKRAEGPPHATRATAEKYARIMESERLRRTKSNPIGSKLTKVRVKVGNHIVPGMARKKNGRVQVFVTPQVARRINPSLATWDVLYTDNGVTRIYTTTRLTYKQAQADAKQARKRGYKKVRIIKVQ